MLKLFKSNHLNNQSSHFIHSWFILKDEPRWTNFQEDMKKTTYLKWPTFAKQCIVVDFDSSSELVRLEPLVINGNSSSKRPWGSQVAKKKQKQLKFKEFVMPIHVMAIIDMGVTTLQKITIIEDQNTMAIFIVLILNLF